MANAPGSVVRAVGPFVCVALYVTEYRLNIPPPMR